jgi:hypothetical protein
VTVVDDLNQLFNQPDLEVDVNTNLLGHGVAVFDRARSYRYLLTRIWDDHEHPLLWCMLNPSTANAFDLDPTISRCLNRTKRAGYGGLIVVNLFALRATNPRRLRGHPDPVGPLNDQFIDVYTRIWPRLICAWGGGGLYQDRAAIVRRRLLEAGVSLVCLGTTSKRQPRHPLYLPASADFQEYQP